MIKIGNITAKRWAQQRRTLLTVNKQRRVYTKLRYITGKQNNKTPMIVQVQRDRKTEYYLALILVLRRCFGWSLMLRPCILLV
jgi:hypothetical protein